MRVPQTGLGAAAPGPRGASACSSVLPPPRPAHGAQVSVWCPRGTPRISGEREGAAQSWGTAGAKRRWGGVLIESLHAADAGWAGQCPGTAHLPRVAWTWQETLLRAPYWERLIGRRARPAEASRSPAAPRHAHEPAAWTSPLGLTLVHRLELLPQRWALVRSSA